MRSIIRANPPARVAAAFLVGGLAVLVVHQPVVGLLHALGSTPITPYSLRATRPWGIPVFLELLGWHLGDPDRLGIGSSAARVGLLGRRSSSWRTAANIDHVVRHLSAQGSLAEQRCRIGWRRQCADRQRHLGSCDCVRMVSDFCRFGAKPRSDNSGSRPNSAARNSIMARTFVGTSRRDG